MANITIDGVTKEYPNGLKYEEIAAEYQKQYGNMIALVLENGKIRELIKPVHKDCTLSFLTLKDVIGHKTYVRTAIMTLMKAVYDVLGDRNVKKVKVEFAIGQGYYINVMMDEHPLVPKQAPEEGGDQGDDHHGREKDAERGDEPAGVKELINQQAQQAVQNHWQAVQRH